MADWILVRARYNGLKVLTALFVLLALSLFGAPSTAQASPVVSGTESVVDHEAAPTRGVRGGTDSLWAAPAVRADSGCCGQHGGRSSPSGCCTKLKCPLTHSGIPPISPQPMPPLEASVASIPSGLLFEGIGTLPALRPPRASV